MIRKTLYSLLLIIIFSLIFLTGCKCEYKFIESTDDIIKIDIINVSENETVIEKELSKEEQEMFIIDFMAMDCYSYFNDPSTDIYGRVVRISYSNGDYEIIDWAAQDIYIDGKYRTGFVYFDQDSFNDLINKYIDE